jgi:hypothetical protein
MSQQITHSAVFRDKLVAREIARGGKFPFCKNIDKEGGIFNRIPFGEVFRRGSVSTAFGCIFSAGSLCFTSSINSSFLLLGLESVGGFSPIPFSAAAASASLLACRSLKVRRFLVFPLANFDGEDSSLCCGSTCGYCESP